MKNMSVDVIEIAPGTYRGWHLWFDIDRTARPLTIRPAGGTVIFDGAGSSSHQGLFYPGWYHYTSHITFQGPFTVENYALGDTGLVSTAWVSHVAFNGFHTSGITGLAGGQLSWTVYVSSDGVHSGSNITFDDWTVGPSANRNVGGLATYHNPNAHGLTALRWTISGASSAIATWGTASGIDIEDWTITGCKYAVSTDGVAAGVLKDNTSTGSTYSVILLSPMVNGPGNSWH